MFIFERERPSQSVSWGGEERERDTESEVYPGPELSAQSLTPGSNS